MGKGKRLTLLRELRPGTCWVTWMLLLVGVLVLVAFMGAVPQGKTSLESQDRAETGG